MPYDFPRQPEGGGRDLYELYQDLWHLVEQLNIKEQEEEKQRESAKTENKTA